MKLRAKPFRGNKSRLILQVLDWARAMPSLIVGQNRVPEGQPGVTDDGWRRWTHDALDKLMVQYSRPLGSLPQQIMACLKQAHYMLGAGSFDGDGSTGFGTPGGSGCPSKGLQPATPQPAKSSETSGQKRGRNAQVSGPDNFSYSFRALGREELHPAVSSGQLSSGHHNPFLAQLQSDADKDPASASHCDKEAHRDPQGLRRSTRHRNQPAFPSRDFSDLSEETLAILEPIEIPDLQELEACLAEGQQSDEVRCSSSYAEHHCRSC